MCGWYYASCDLCDGKFRKGEHSDQKYCIRCWEFYEEPGGPQLDPEERPPESLSNHPHEG